MSLTALIQQHQNDLSELDQEILSFFLEHEPLILSETITTLSQHIPCSKSSILRLCKKLGFSGFSEFKFYLKQFGEIDSNQNHNTLTMQLEDIQNTLKIIQQTDFTPLIACLHTVENVYCYGTGFSQKNALQEFSKSLLTCNKRSLIMPAKTELDLNMPLFTKKDLVIFGSLSGETNEIRENIQMLKLRKIPFLSVTKFTQNSLASQADFNLFYCVTSMNLTGKSQSIESLVTMDITLDALFRKYISFLNSIE